MTNQQMQYAYWQRMRQQQVYQAYVAGAAQKKETQEPKIEALCFTAKEAGAKISFNAVIGEFKTSTDGINWTDYTSESEITLPTEGSKVYFSAKTTNDTCYDKFNMSNCKFTINSGKIAASGNIMSLLDSECKRLDLSRSDNCFQSMFDGCTALVSAPSLPATTLAQFCYESMFNGCTALTSIEKLPATTLADCCYTMMFYGCTSLRISENDPSRGGNVILDLPVGTSEPSNWGFNMFSESGGAFKDAPSIGNTYRCY